MQRRETMLKLIASDLDGTLLQGTREISREAVAMIKKLSEMETAEHQYPAEYEWSDP